MPRSEWLRNLAIVTVAASSIVLLVNVPLSIWEQYDRSSHWYREYQEQTQHYKKESADKIAGLCEHVVPANPALRDCLLKGIEAYQQDDTSKQDLKAQQDMAYWALWLLIVSAVGLVVSVGGLWTLLHSLKQTRIAIRDTRELGEAQMRAYVSLVEDEKQSFMGPRRMTAGIVPEVKFKFTNSGSTPAKNQRYVATLEVMDHPAPAPSGDGGAIRQRFPANQ